MRQKRIVRVGRLPRRRVAPALGRREGRNEALSTPYRRHEVWRLVGRETCLLKYRSNYSSFLKLLAERGGTELNIR